MADTLAKLGIDLWGVVLYLVNFGVLYLLLSKFLLKPLFAAMDKRRDTIRENVAEAERLRVTFQEETEKLKRDSEEKLAAIQDRAESVAAAAKKEADKLVADAEAKRAKMLAETRQHIESMKESLIEEAEREIMDRIEKVVRSVLKTSVPPTVVKKSVEDGWRETSK